MRNIVILFLLIFSTTSLMAQTLFTRRDSIAITGDSVTLRSGQYRGAIQWQHSLDGQTWSILTGKTNPVLKVSKYSEGYYRAQITDNNCLPDFSDTAVVVAYKTGNPRVIDPDEVNGTRFLERDGSTFTFISLSDTMIPVNTVFVENDKQSDIRVVSGVVKRGDTLTVNTLPGKMEDLFVNYRFKLSSKVVAPAINTTYLSNTALSNSFTDSDGFIHPVEIIDLLTGDKNLVGAGTTEDTSFVQISENLSGEKLYNSNGLEITITDGFFNLETVLKSEFDFKQSRFQWTDLPSGKLKTCKFYTDGEKTNAKTKLIIESKANGEVSMDETFVLKQGVYKNLFKYWVGEIPVWMYVKIDLMAKVKGNFGSTFSVTGGASSDLSYYLGASFVNGEWSFSSDYSKTVGLFDPVSVGHTNYLFLCEVFPRIETSFFYAQCPYLEIGSSVIQEMDYSISGNYNSSLSVALEANAGVNGDILGYGIPSFDKAFKSVPDTLYREPTKLEILSGNNQVGFPGEELAQPIVVRVLNPKNNPISGALVHLYPVAGSVNDLALVSDNEGKVFVKWTLGEVIGGQFLEAYLEGGDDKKINKTVLTLNAECKIELPTVETNSISDITENSAFCGGNVINDGGADVTLRGVCWNTFGNPTTANSKTMNGTGTGSFTSGLYGLSVGTVYYVRAYAINSKGTAYGNQVSFKPGSLVDYRDGKSYRTVVIGGQTWMAENLAYLPYITPDNSWSETSACYYVYDKATYGVLYNWPAAMSACPVGWHLPSDTEWDVLADYLGGFEVAGGKMKTEEGWSIPNVGATNESHFSGLPGGGFNHGSYFNAGNRGYWWSSTEIDATLVWDRSLYYIITDLYRHYYFREVGFSVRCLKD
jgi:uncharacterized protein (TIGR02145 family)